MGNLQSARAPNPSARAQGPSRCARRGNRPRSRRARVEGSIGFPTGAVGDHLPGYPLRPPTCCASSETPRNHGWGNGMASAVSFNSVGFSSPPAFTPCHQQIRPGSRKKGNQSHATFTRLNGGRPQPLCTFACARQESGHFRDDSITKRMLQLMLCWESLCKSWRLRGGLQSLSATPRL